MKRLMLMMMMHTRTFKTRIGRCTRRLLAAMAACAMMVGTAVVGAIVVGAAAPAALAAEPAAQQLEFFEKKIRPLFVEHCYKCHSAQAKKLKGGLHLDRHAGVMQGGDSGAEVTPGEPDKSRLIEAVRYKNVDLQMPPKGKLTDEQIAALVQWVKQGAAWPKEAGGKPAPAVKSFDLSGRRGEHWAWRPVRAVAPPSVHDENWPHDPIDRFILARLEAAGLHPAPAADRRALLRRVWFDLVGLPPPAEAVEAFVNDASSDAYAKVVDALLDSPQFGQRWARHWLDLMRYAESYGHEFDYNIPEAWRYRDYVIDALNDDLPYDQFVTEHVAGDLLPQPRRHPTRGYDESILATAFWYMHEQSHAPTDVAQHESDRIDNQIDVFSKTFLGMTVGCARCHDHKFDAISTKDYYALAGFMQSSREQLAYLDPGGRIAAALGAAMQVTAKGDEAIAASGVAAPAGTTADSPNTVLFDDFNRDTYGGWFATGQAWGQGPTNSGQWDSAAGGAVAVRPGLAHSGMFGGKFRGTLRSPTFTIEHPQIHIRAAGKGAVRLVIDGYTMAHFSSLLFNGTQATIDRPGKLGWTTLAGDLKMYLGHSAYLEFIDDSDDYFAVDEVRFSDGGARLCADEPLSAEPAQGAAAATFATLATALAEAVKATPAPMRALCIADGTGEDSHVYVRGSHKTLGDVVPRRFLEALAGPKAIETARGSGRLELARQLTDPANPLTARVMVNRIWHHLLGRGIVATTDNFGVLGQPPTHPLLLDHLADRFVKDGWSIKRMIRAIVMSSTYQMASRSDAAGERADPQNLLLHRMPVKRLEGEAIRDAILAISGRLNDKMHGPSVPVHLTSFMDGRGRPGQSGPLDGDGRRSIYIAVRRNFLWPMMLAFDTPQPASTVGRRSVSNVPAQALIMMNDPFVVQQAQVWAKRLLSQKDLAPAQRIERMYVAAFARPPSDAERDQALAFLDAQGESYGLPADRRASDQRVWADLCHVLFNVKEFIFVR